MSALVERAIARAGLSEVADARRAGDSAALRGFASKLRAADLLALGALADRIRAEEVGDVVRVFEQGEDEDGVEVVREPREGLAFLRAVAVARVTGPRGARIRVDWDHVGLELAQVALGFGASELAGVLANKRGLPILEGDMMGSGKRSARELAQVVKQRELAGFIERSGRRPIFVSQEEERP